MQLNDQVTAEVIELAYLLLLGRPAESEAAISGRLNNRTVLDIRNEFIRSAEFRNNLASVSPEAKATLKALDGGRNIVETDISSEQLRRMIAHVEANWKILGQNDPHWSVLTSEKFRRDTIGDNSPAFFESGKKTVDFFKAACERANLDISKLKTCFELGCGVGRITIWLAKMFERVTAADVSASHLLIADQEITQREISNVDLLLTDSMEKYETIGKFDCFFSIIVLQHNPPPVSVYILRKMLNSLNPGGVAYFQIPTYEQNRSFKVEDYLSGLQVSGQMEVHAVPQSVIWQLFRELDCDVCDVREDNWTGSPRIVSNSFLVQKRAG